MGQCGFFQCIGLMEHHNIHQLIGKADCIFARCGTLDFLMAGLMGFILGINDIKGDERILLILAPPCRKQSFRTAIFLKQEIK